MLNKMLNEFTEAKTIDDVMTCPYCESDYTYIYSTDYLLFDSDGSGRYAFDCHCKSCKTDFRKDVNFKYNIVSEIIE